MRIVLLGNAGAGKSIMARRLTRGRNIKRLSLDEIAWSEGTQRKPLQESLAELHRFIDAHDEWIIEGCYSDLVEAALPFCSELRFLNPGVQVCVKHCRKRPWEPEKFATAAEQAAMRDTLVRWVEEYATRDDEYGLQRHRKIFNDFAGPKKEYTTLTSYEDD